MLVMNIFVYKYNLDKLAISLPHMFGFGPS